MIEKQGQGIITESKLRSVYDQPSDFAEAKQLNRLDTYCGHFIKVVPIRSFGHHRPSGPD